jgi:hypothetical protein
MFFLMLLSLGYHGWALIHYLEEPSWPAASVRHDVQDELVGS